MHGSTFGTEKAGVHRKDEVPGLVGLMGVGVS